MARIIPVAHDFVCEWCWIGLFQAKRMRREFGVEIDWLGYELFPAWLVEEKKPREPMPPNKPLTPGRLTLAYEAAGIEPVRKPPVDSHAAHEAVEFAKLSGVQDRLLERIYYAYWKENVDISDIDALISIADGVFEDLEGLREAIISRKFADKITQFDEAAFANGVYNVPTFWIDGQRYAEQPWSRLATALKQPEGVPDFYANLNFPYFEGDRPYVLINMVTTIDGKILTGNRGEPVEDLGSKTDHLMMRRIQSAAEGVLIGAGAQRSSERIWYPKNLYRFVVTRSGNVLVNSRFFTDAPEMAFVVCPESAELPELPDNVRVARAGKADVDWSLALSIVRSEIGIKRLLVEGGSEINAQLFHLNIPDELFLTLAPKIKLGEGVPTYADGMPLPREQVQKYDLIEENRWGSEVFLRYRRLP
ncbi:MAG: DsbA family protein [Armatimonadetes bacterium]|nr:DsbA family protein [Armatimonadota bacterium]